MATVRDPASGPEAEGDEPAGNAGGEGQPDDDAARERHRRAEPGEVVEVVKPYPGAGGDGAEDDSKAGEDRTQRGAVARQPVEQPEHPAVEEGQGRRGREQANDHLHSAVRCPGVGRASGVDAGREGHDGKRDDVKDSEDGRKRPEVGKCGFLQENLRSVDESSLAISRSMSGML